jgi:thymidylate kinase
MLVAFTGPQSSGKSTLINLLKDYTDKHNLDFVYVGSSTRTLKSKGFTINNIGESFDKTQRAVIRSHLDNIKYYNGRGGNVVLDRCLLDGVVYTRYFYNQGKVSDNIMNHSEFVLKNYYSVYDIVFYLDPAGVPLVADNERSTDVTFRKDIIDIFNEYLLEYKIIKLTGTIDNRLDIIKDTISKYR